MSLTGGSPLGNALFAGPERVRLLLAAGVDPNQVTPSSCGPVRGATAIHMAAWQGLGAALTVLLDAGATPTSKPATARSRSRVRAVKPSRYCGARGARER